MLRELSKYQKSILLVAWLGWVFDVMDASLFTFTKKSMLTHMMGAAQYKLHGTAVEGLIQTWFLVGWALGGFIFGVLADRWGRKQVLITTVLMYCVCTGLTAFCVTPEQVAIARFFTALGIGGEWAAGAALVAEAMPDSFRPRAATILQTAAAFGPMLGALANLLLQHLPWNAMYLVGLLPASICFLVRLKVEAPANELSKPASTLPTDGNFLSPVIDLFSSPIYRPRASVAICLGVVGVTGAGIFPFWLPNLVKKVTTGDSASLVTYATWMLHLGTLGGVIAFPWLCQVWGRKRSFALFFALAPVAIGFTLFQGNTYIKLLCCLPLVSFTTIGLSAGFGLYFPELFPPSLRATGSGLAYNAGRIVSAPVPAVMGLLASNGNLVYTIAFSALIYLFGLAALPFAPETKGQPLLNQG